MIPKKATKTKTSSKNSDVALSDNAFESKQTLSIEGCEIILNFLPESNGNAIDSVKKILTSMQHQNISYNIGETG